MAVKSLKRSSVKSTQKANAMNAGYSFQDFELIESVFLSANAASVTFSNLNQYATEYSHLQIRVVGRSTRSTISDVIEIRFNGDTASSYNRHSLYGNGSSVISEALAPSSGIQVCRVAGASQAAGNFGSGVIDVLDAYSTAKHKTIRTLNGVTQDNYIFLQSGAWRNLNAIDSINLFSGTSSNIVAGSRFSLYGIR